MSYILFKVSFDKPKFFLADNCIYLFLTTLGHCCFAQAFSSCRDRGLLCCGAQVSHCSGFSYWGAQALGAWAQYLWPTMGLVVPHHVESSQIRNQTRVPCISRQVLNHWASKEVPPEPILTGLEGAGREGPDKA